MSGARAELDETLTVEMLWKIGCWYILYIYIYLQCMCIYIPIYIYRNGEYPNPQWVMNPTKKNIHAWLKLLRLWGRHCFRLVFLACTAIACCELWYVIITHLDGFIYVIIVLIPITHHHNHFSSSSYKMWKLPFVILHSHGRWPIYKWMMRIYLVTMVIFQSYVK